MVNGETKERVPDLILHVPGLPPVAGADTKTDSASTLALQRLREHAARAAARRPEFQLDIGPVGLELTVFSPSPADVGSGARCLNAVAWGLAARPEEALKDPCGTRLIRDFRQIVHMRFRWEEGADSSYWVRLWLVTRAS